MTYQIYYIPKDDDQNSRGYCLFDIEYYMEDFARCTCVCKLWYSEVKCLPCVKGLSYFLKDKLAEDGFDFQTFINDGTEIQEIRRVLYEQYDNSPKTDEEAGNFHYNVFGKLLKEKLKNFCNQYNCWLNID